jgi:hypothetical protein
LNIDLSKRRTYDYITGRWWQVDPLADEIDLVSFTPYNYSFNNPILYSDPEGDFPFLLPLAAWGIAEGLAAAGIGATVGVAVLNGDAVVEGLKQAGSATWEAMGTVSPYNSGVAPAMAHNQAGELSSAKPLNSESAKSNNSNSPATEPYKRPNNATTPKQRQSVQGKPCTTCGKENGKNVADHKKPLVKEHYETGKIDKKQMRSVEAVQPQCQDCSNKQGAEMSKYSQEQKRLLEQRQEQAQQGTPPPFSLLPQ